MNGNASQTLETSDKVFISLSEKIERVLIKGDLSVLSEQERVVYYQKVCESVGLNPLTKPFEYILLNGKLVLYATKSCTDQLRSIHKISIEISSREKIGDVYVVTARAKDPMGRTDESTGAVAIGKSVGDLLANAYMKAETKAKRRVTLSICGLGLLDESEVESIPSVKVEAPQERAEAVPKALPSPEAKAAEVKAESKEDPNYRIDLGLTQKGTPNKFNGMTMKEADQSHNPHGGYSIHTVYDYYSTKSKYRSAGIYEFMAQYEAYMAYMAKKQKPAEAPSQDAGGEEEYSF